MDAPHAQSWLGWMVLPLRRYARFKGRSGRREFWFYSLFLGLGYLAIVVLAFAIAIAWPESETLIGSVFIGGWTLFFAANFVPGLALTTRRLHDMGLSGALLIVIFAALAILNVVGWLGYLVWMSLPGQRQENRHGLPIGHHDVSEVFL